MRAAKAMLAGRDCIISAETGSGKTLAFVMPALSRLSYPPETYLEDMKVGCVDERCLAIKTL